MRNDEVDKLLEMEDYLPFYMFREIYIRLSELIYTKQFGKDEGF